VQLDEVLMGVVAELDEGVFAHCKRVQALALLLGETIGLTSLELNQLGLGAFLHDIGKRYIPADVLNKEAPLTPEEWELVQTHPKLGFELAETLGLGDSVKRIILEHHLWADGRGGYPRETGYTTPSFLSQITTVADVVDAMTSHRPYRQALDLATCLDYLTENAETKFNASVVAVFQSLVSQGLFGSEWPSSPQADNPSIPLGLAVGRR
jgi:putative nucleotidyltransferase with HDIG domain